MGLDVKVLDSNDEEIDLKQTFDDDDFGFGHVATEEPEFNEVSVADAENLDGYGITDENGEEIAMETDESSDMMLDENND